MRSQLIEVDNQGNWGKMLVGQFDHELTTISVVTGDFLLDAVESRIRNNRVDPRLKRLVLDLQTGEGVLLFPSPDRDPKQDLDNHSIWVCPLYYPFISWLYKQDVSDVTKLPTIVNLSPGEAILQGYRRSGPDMVQIATIREKLMAAFAVVEAAPITQTEIVYFIQSVITPEEWVLYRLFRDSLSATDSNRWLGALLAESGRYISAPVGGTKVGLIPKR